MFTFLKSNFCKKNWNSLIFDSWLFDMDFSIKKLLACWVAFFHIYKNQETWINKLLDHWIPLLLVLSLNKNMYILLWKIITIFFVLFCLKIREIIVAKIVDFYDLISRDKSLVDFLLKVSWNYCCKNRQFLTLNWAWQEACLFTRTLTRIFSRIATVLKAACNNLLKISIEKIDTSE